MTITSDTLFAYLRDHLSVDTTGVTETTLLFTEGLLDSFSVADLLVFIEDEGGFTVEPEEVTLDNLDSVARILAFIERRSR